MKSVIDFISGLGFVESLILYALVSLITIAFLNVVVKLFSYVTSETARYDLRTPTREPDSLIWIPLQVRFIETFAKVKRFYSLPRLASPHAALIPSLYRWRGTMRAARRAGGKEAVQYFNLPKKQWYDLLNGIYVLAVDGRLHIFDDPLVVRDQYHQLLYQLEGVEDTE